MAYSPTNSKWSIYNEDILGIFDKLNSYNQTATQLIEEHNLDPTLHNALRKYISTFIKFELGDKELLDASIKLAKSNQRLKDTNRVERKAFRESARIENAISEYNKALIAGLEKESLHLDKFKFPKFKANKNGKLVIQLSDLHLNELIDIADNQYDFYVASKRLQLLAEEAISIGKWRGINSCLIAMCGDFINSDRRLSELMVAATNRSNATLLAVELLAKFILHLRQHFTLTFAGVTGNESRVGQILEWEEIVATDNFDNTIYGMLRILLNGKKGFTFTPFRANENVVNVNGYNFLLLHGHQVGQNAMQKKIMQICGKYSARGIKIDMVIFGHIHSCYMSDYFSRNASVCGGNAYSSEALNFVSKASQNIHIVEPNRLHGVKVDLQNIEDVEGYDISAEHDLYNAKSLERHKDRKVIVQVVV